MKVKKVSKIAQGEEEDERRGQIGVFKR